MRRTTRKSLRGKRGFTLIELLAALAIGSVIIVAVAGLTYNIAFHFDRGTRGVEVAENIVQAVDRIGADIGGARYLNVETDRGPIAAFSGAPNRIVFIAPARVVTKGVYDDVVDFTVESDAKGSRLIRRRTPWSGPRMPLDKIEFGDPVTLLDGPYEFELAYGHLDDRGRLIWEARWDGEKTLPRYVRMSVHDRNSGFDVLAGMTFAIRADAPSTCASAEAKATCASGGPAPADAKNPQGQPNQNPQNQPPTPGNPSPGQPQ